MSGPVGDVELLTAAAAREADAAAIAAGDDAAVLMARAAGHLARTVIASAGRAYGLRVDLVVGRGDNGGDGWVAALLLAYTPASSGSSSIRRRDGGRLRGLQRRRLLHLSVYLCVGMGRSIGTAVVSWMGVNWCAYRDSHARRSVGCL